MANAPSDLLAARSRIQQLTRLPAVSVGIVGDPTHLAGGGYHIGKTDLIHIAGFGPAGATISNIRQARTDYSVRLTRDKNACTDEASALDIGAEWPVGGRAAWLRFNRMLVTALQSGDPALASIRAINFSRDGVERKRIDREHGFNVIEDSTDSVTVHTHIEWYRDTVNSRGPSLDRIAALTLAAITNSSPQPPPVSSTDEDDEMLPNTQIPKGFDPNDAVALGFPQTEGFGLSFCVDTGVQEGDPAVVATEAWFRVALHAATDSHGSWTRIDIVKVKAADRRVDYTWPASLHVDKVFIRREPVDENDQGVMPAGVLSWKL